MLFDDITIDSIKREIAEKLVKSVLPSLFLIIIAIIVSLLPYPEQWIRLVPAIFASLLLTIIWSINVFGKSIRALNIMILSLALIILTGMLINGGIRNPIYFGILPLTALVSWVYEKSMVIIIAIASIFIGAFFMIIDYIGHTNHIHESEPVMIWLISSSFIVLIVSASTIPAKIFKKSIIKHKEQNLEAQAAACKAELAAIKLAQREEDLKLTLNSIGDAVIATDEKGFITRINKQAELLTCYKEKEALHLPIDEIFIIIKADNGRKCKNPVAKVIKHGERTAIKENILLRDKNKSEKLISYSVSPISDNSGIINGTIITFRDISNEYLIQEQLRQSKQIDAIGELAGSLAHDFNNMLLGINGAADLLEKRMTLNDDNVKYIDIIRKATLKAENLTNKLLAFSRKSHLDITKTDVHDIIKSVIDIISPNKNKTIKITLNLTADLSIISGDSTALKNCFLNLAMNSFEAMKNGGILNISTSTLDVDEEYCESSPFPISTGKYIKIIFRDNGIGISDDQLHRIFEPFYSTKNNEENAGLGLSAVYGIIHQHKGEIIIKSKIGKETVCEILIPLTDKKSEYELPDSLDIPIIEGTILLIDDEEVVRFSVKCLLEESGYKVITAENGLEGLKEFRNHRKDINLVLLDTAMPVMNGTECFLSLRNESAEIPIVITSGYMDNVNIAWLKNKGLTAFMQKPFREDDLKKIVQKYINN